MNLPDYLMEHGVLKGEDARQMAKEIQAQFAIELDACLKRLGENDEEIMALRKELALLKEYRAMAVDREQAIRNEANVQRARANTAVRCFEQLRDALKQMPK